MNKWNCIKIKSFCTGREIVTRLKRQPTEWEKISTNNSSHKGIIFRIYRELQKLNPQRINFPMKKWLHELNREVFNFPGYNRDAYQNNTYISSHPSLNGHIQGQ
jgi:hypothetical protein